MHLSVLPACMCVHRTCFWCLEKTEESIRFPGACKGAHESLWVLATKHRSSPRAASAVNCWTFSLASVWFNFDRNNYS